MADKANSIDQCWRCGQIGSISSSRYSFRFHICNSIPMSLPHAQMCFGLIIDRGAIRCTVVDGDDHRIHLDLFGTTTTSDHSLSFSTNWRIGFINNSFLCTQNSFWSTSTWRWTDASLNCWSIFRFPLPKILFLVPSTHSAHLSMNIDRRQVASPPMP